MTETKKVWSEPELIVLVRSKPEEAVLEACKASGQAGAPLSQDVQCTDSWCAWCNTLVGS